MDGSQASGAHQTLHRHDNVRKPRLTCRRYRRASSRHSVRATARRLPLEREAQAESDEHEARQSVDSAVDARARHHPHHPVRRQHHDRKIDRRLKHEDCPEGKRHWSDRRTVRDEAGHKGDEEDADLRVE